MAEHGTYAGYRQHRRTGDLPACGPCNEANQQQHQQWRQSASERERLYNRAAGWAKNRLVAAHRHEYHQLLHARLNQLEQEAG